MKKRLRGGGDDKDLGRVAVWFGLLAGCVTLAAQDIAVTVQGRLSHEGRPVNGPHDFYFTLRSAPDGEILAEMLRPEVPVKDGLFTVPVTFRPAFFDVFYTGDDGTRSDERLLEVSVRPSGGDETAVATNGSGGRVGLASPPGRFTPLQPALRITAAPTAIHAASAATVTPGAVTPAALSLASSLSGLVSVASGKFTVTPAPAPSWLLTGNAGTAATNFLGTTDHRPLEVRVANSRALLIEPGALGPNLIGGHPGNAVIGAAGAVIAGGGAAASPNLVEANYAFIGGGLSNYVSGVAAVVSGGTGNVATNMYAVVSGGSENLARDSASTVAGGAGNQSAGFFAAIGGGRSNQTGGQAATIAGGDGNVAMLDGATIGGGQGNESAGVGATVSGGVGNRAHLDLATVSGGGENWAQTLGATVGGGVGNQAHGVNSTVAGGGANRATGAYSSIPGGTQALATHHGQMAQSSGVFAELGDAQTSVFVLRGETSVAAPGGDLSLDGQGVPLRIGPEQTVTFDILIVGRSEGLPPNFQVSGGYSARGVIKRVGGVASFVGTPTVVELGEDDPAWRAELLTGPDHLLIRVNSAATPDGVRWVARVQTAETSWGGPIVPSP